MGVEFVALFASFGKFCTPYVRRRVGAKEMEEDDGARERERFGDNGTFCVLARTGVASKFNCAYVPWFLSPQRAEGVSREHPTSSDAIRCMFSYMFLSTAALPPHSRL